MVFGLYEEPVTPGQCNMVVERLGDYLIEQGLWTIYNVLYLFLYKSLNLCFSFWVLVFRFYNLILGLPGFYFSQV